MEAVPGAPWEWCALVVQGGRSRSGARASCVRCCVYSYSCLTASVWLADAQAGGSPGEAQGASLLRHRREGLRPHGSRGPVGPQGASSHLCPQTAVGQQRKGGGPVVGAGEAEPRRPHDRQARARERGSPLRCGLHVGCVLDPYWQLLCCFRDAAYVYPVLPVLCPRSALPAPPPSTQVPSASHIYACSTALNNFNDGWSPTAPTGC